MGQTRIYPPFQDAEPSEIRGNKRKRGPRSDQCYRKGQGGASKGEGGHGHPTLIIPFERFFPRCY